MKIIRWKAVVPMLLTAGVAALLWTLYVDVAIRRAIEFAGAELVGAKVDVASVRLRLRSADLVITGLQVTNPDAPMTNLIDVPEMVADLNGRALLSKKAVVESLIVRGVRFGTPRKTSGALKDLPKTAGLVTRRMLAWVNSIPIPTLDLEGLAGMAIRIPAISADSLRSVKEARAMVAQGDSLRTAWEQTLRALDPAPTVDSSRAVLERLRATDYRRLDAGQLASTANEARTAISRVDGMKARIAEAKVGVDAGLGSLRAGVGALDAARQADYAYARGLVKLPALNAPDVSMALFGRMVTERLKPLMYWFNVAEQYVPPGLDPRRRSGPERLRMAGTDFIFPLEHTWPQFLVERAEADLAIGGRTVAAGSYSAQVTGATTEPAVYGQPMRFRAERRSSVGPRDLKIGGLMDHAGHIQLDSLDAVVPGVQVPAFEIPGANAKLDLGDSGLVTLGLISRGGQLGGRWRLNADAVRWLRNGADTTTGPAPALGSKAWVEALLWRSISTVRDVSIEAQISGVLASPGFAISSNVGDAVSRNLKQALGAEFQRAEQQVRAEVDRQVNAQITAARARLTDLESQARDKLGVPEAQLAQLQTDLQAQLNQLTQVVPGVRLPSLPGLPRRP